MAASPNNLQSKASSALPALAALLALAVTVPPAKAQRVNVAKYQSVSASSQSGTYLDDFAVDGIVSSFHSHRTTNHTSGNPIWLEVSYPLPIAIASAHLYSGLLESNTTTQVLSSFRYQYHDGLSWLDIPGSTVTNNTQPEVAVVFSNAVSATRFRLFSTNTGNRTIRELALFPANVISNVEQGYPLGTDVNLNLAFKRPATASSVVLSNSYGPGYAKNAFDGYLDNKSRWLATTNSPGEYIEVDLLGTNLISSAHVHSGFMDTNRVNSQALASFELQHLSGTNWITIPGTTFTNNTNTSLVIPFSTNVATSRVRLVATTNSPVRLQELLLFPPRSGGYPIGDEVTNALPSTNTWERLSDTIYRIRNAGPDLRIGLVSGAVVNVAADANNPMRTEWQLLLNYRDGTYRVRNSESGLCLATARDLSGRISTSNNTQVVAEQYTGLPHQDWRMIYTNATNVGNFFLANAYSGLVIQPSGNSYTAGTPLVASTPATNNVTQLWNANFRRHYPKKGIGATIGTSSFNTNITFHRDLYDRFGETSWSYGWGRNLLTNFPYIDTNHTYNPMQWGNFSWTHGSAQGPMENLHRELQSNPKPAFLMGFNEPDKEEQGFISVEDAIMRWPRFEARDVPLVSPVPANTFTEWNTNFFNQAEDNGYRIDHWAVHRYAGPDATSLINVLGRAYTNYGFRPIWLTEFSVVEWSPGTWTDKDNFDFLAEFMWRAEGISWIKRYALFAFTEGGSTNNPDFPDAPRSNAFNSDGSLTPFGQLYAGWDGVTNVVTNRAYHLHGYGAYRRGNNPGSPSAPTAVSPTSNVAGLQWTLFPATTTTNTNTFRIISTLDGRPLRTTNGTNVTLGTNGETGTPVEWRLVADQYGLQYIQHPASSNRRLHLASNSSTLTMVASNNTTDFSQWRFVGPAVTEVASLPTVPSPFSVLPATTNSALVIAWSNNPANHTGFRLERSPNGTNGWTNVATPGANATAQTNTGLNAGTTYHYRLAATNILGDSPYTSVAQGTTLTLIQAWRHANFNTSTNSGNSANSANPDLDQFNNLQEYAFGLNPNVGNNAAINANGGTITQRGGPTVTMTNLTNGVDFLALFARRIDHVAAGLTYTVRFSADLQGWENSTATPTVIATNSEIEAVTVPYPLILTNGKKPQFFRVQVVAP